MDKQIKQVQDVLKKVGDFQRQLGHSLKNWLENMQAPTMLLDCENVRKVCVFEAQIQQAEVGGVLYQTPMAWTMKN